MTTTEENEMNLLAWAAVQRGSYPAPAATLDTEIGIQMQLLQNYKNGVLQRPANRQEYQDLIQDLNADIQALITQNNQIVASNRAARQAVDDLYNDQIAAFKLVPANIHAARVNVVKKNFESQFSDIRNSYVSAVIMNDTVRIQQCRADYQALITAYNAALAARGLHDGK
jgi:hypothetical protein